jgi:hypothetical protein
VFGTDMFVVQTRRFVGGGSQDSQGRLVELMRSAESSLLIRDEWFDASQNLTRINAALFEEVGAGAFTIGGDGAKQILGIGSVAAELGGFVQGGDEGAAHARWETLPHNGGLYAE